MDTKNPNETEKKTANQEEMEQQQVTNLQDNQTEKAEETETYWNEDITETLSKYFDVTVTSVHADDSEYLRVWICYKE